MPPVDGLAGLQQSCLGMVRFFVYRFDARPNNPAVGVGPRWSRLQNRYPDSQNTPGLNGFGQRTSSTPANRDLPRVRDSDRREAHGKADRVTSGRYDSAERIACSLHRINVKILRVKLYTKSTMSWSLTVIVPNS